MIPRPHLKMMSPPRDDAPETAESGQRGNQLRQVQETVEELLLSTAQQCLQAVGSEQIPEQEKYDTETNRLLPSLNQLPTVPASPMKPASAPAARPATPLLTKHRPETSRVQLRLSKRLVRILAAFAKAGHRPSGMVEKIMWKDAQIRDAAAILRVEFPVRQSSAADSGK